MLCAKCEKHVLSIYKKCNGVCWCYLWWARSVPKGATVHGLVIYEGYIRELTGRFCGPMGRTTGGAINPHTTDDPKGSADSWHTVVAAVALPG